MRFVRSLITLGFVLFGVAVLMLAVGGYLTATGRSLPVMRTAAARFGALTAGQTTTQLSVSVALKPEARRLSGIARLRVRAEAEGRERVYLLLNDGLSVSSVWQESGGSRHPLRHVQLWLVTVVELAEPVAAGSEISLGVAYEGDPFSGLSPLGQRVMEADEVILTPTDLWYPTDFKSFFRADVEVTLPSALTLVHPGTAQVVTELGSSQRVRWTAARAVTGLSLVAGRYNSFSREASGVVHRVFLRPDLALDGAQILDSMVDSFDTLSASYGGSGAARQAVFVSQRLERPFADGSGLVGLTPALFRDGDYGYSAIAEGLAGAWWGGMVAAQATDPGAGGAWIVDGFAANAARQAVRKRFGAGAEFRWRMARMFDPKGSATLSQMSILEDELEDPGRTRLRTKASLVASLLEATVGSADYLGAAKKYLATNRGGFVSTGTLREAFAAESGMDLKVFFDQWVDSVAEVDLSLDPNQGSALVANHQVAVVGPKVEMWRVPPGGQPVEQTIVVGGSTPVGNAERIVVDPRGVLPDMYRSNNVLPREDGPRAIARSVRGEWMIVEGEPHEWAPARVRVIDAAGKTLHSWEFEFGLMGTPRWSADGTRILAVEPARGGTQKLYALHSMDGSQRVVGQDTEVAGGVDALVAARKGRLVVLRGDEVRTIAHHGRGRVANPALSPDGTRVAYAAVYGVEMELRVARVDGDGDEVLMTWPASPVRWIWAPSSTRLYAILAGDWDWQLWEIPLEGAPRVLVREASGAHTLAVSPDGNRIALAAQAKLDYRFERYEVFVIDRNDPTAPNHFTVSGQNVVDLAWRDDDSMFVVVTDPTYAMVPARRDIRVLRLGDGSVLDFP